MDIYGSLNNMSNQSGDGTRRVRGYPGRSGAGADAGSLLRRNAHPESFPGFPAGVNPRQLLDLMGEQAETAGW